METLGNNEELLRQLQDLAKMIEQTRREVSAIRPDEMKRQFIPTARDELDAIVEATATATHAIMDAAECLMEISGRANGEDVAKGTAAVMAIFEACTFQDITGQRVTKVVQTLQTIQQRLDLLSGHASDEAPPALTGTQRSGDEALLNGPALPGQGHNQQDVDALMAAES